MKPAVAAALYARLFTLLADRPELHRHDSGERVEILLRDSGIGAPNTLDVQFIQDAGELDLLCGAAVRRLREPSTGQAAVLDLLGYLTPERMVGLAYALPESRRRAIVNADGAFAYHVAQFAEEMDAALLDVDWLASITSGEGSANIAVEMGAADLRRLEAFRRALHGLPAELSDEDRELVDAIHASPGRSPADVLAEDRR